MVYDLGKKSFCLSGYYASYDRLSFYEMFSAVNYCSASDIDAYLGMLLW